MTSRFRLLLAALLCAAAAAAQAQAYPSKPIRIVVGFTAGGVIDAFARQLAPKLSASMGQPVIVENRAGANGIVAMDYVAKQPGDGYTVLLGTLGTLSLAELFYPNLPYVFERDFAPVTQVNSVALLMVANAELPVRTVADLVGYVKANPGRANYSSSGNGSSPNLAGEMFNATAGIKATHVPYKGSGQSFTDLLGGQVQFTIDAVAIALPHVKSGRLRAIASTGRQRLAILPDVPTVADTLPGFEVTNWYGLVAPKATPREIVTRLRDEIAKAVNASDMRERMAAEGMVPVASTPQEFGDFMKRETVRWTRVIKDAGIRVD